MKATFVKDKTKSLLYEVRTLEKHLKRRGYTDIELDSHDNNFVTFEFKERTDYQEISEMAQSVLDRKKGKSNA